MEQIFPEPTAVGPTVTRTGSRDDDGTGPAVARCLPSERLVGGSCLCGGVEMVSVLDRPPGDRAYECGCADSVSAVAFARCEELPSGGAAGTNAVATANPEHPNVSIGTVNGNVTINTTYVGSTP